MVVKRKPERPQFIIDSLKRTPKEEKLARYGQKEFIKKSSLFEEVNGKIRIVKK